MTILQFPFQTDLSCPGVKKESGTVPFLILFYAPPRRIPQGSSSLQSLLSQMPDLLTPRGASYFVSSVPGIASQRLLR